MESKLVKGWLSQGLKPSKDFDFFTRRSDMVVGKVIDKPAKVEYECPFCKFYEIKEIEMEKDSKGKKFKRPKFTCSSCKKVILVEGLKKAK
ncbi:MAG: hypothetical protein COY38_04170 [Candidatus Aenigmarchaeota archaeon CG_4_10_14_0_8_um_filter_37_24]|nr:hypothetical protein [Candidatus Aenigmarchaeota archaeon]OIN85915.1 MAG: hypothetical protein AUJ50_04575 [Candidatus Aenigmarchaeota archaeon CG1_02_38_14]PIV68829.1 MAG: hypothetical protein COS07_02880 [Candidatus Aenigmarchaeota archaeon CG01_land_8_20_14_3_00_37_9]PIW40858.1 MAG: hypothetical protein COW21_04950 [Candidatus Aenigmarchaeota archaeon CG15_BIG_FIL_POST_REV_8_21_14_020_37_27]PIX51122.1 MAG: hypothetical protein COZ52_00495 [Candidatus Aenigmarchaeota archaeon CG_4_8_14_3_u